MKNKGIISILLSGGAVFLTHIIWGLYYGVNDDYQMNAKIAGAEHDEYMVFINIVLGKFMKLLYEIAGEINWYAVCMLILLIVDCAVLMCIYWTLFDSIFGTVPILMIEIIIGLYLTFTTIAFMSCAAAFIYGVYALQRHDKNKRTRVKDILLFVILLVSGFMWRRDAFLCGFVLLLPMIVYGKTKINKRVWGIVLLSAVLFLGMNGYHNYKYSQGKWKEYSSYIKARGIVDYHKIDYQEHEEELKRLEISENDIDCLYRWIFADKEIFSEKKLVQLAQVDSLSEKYELSLLRISKKMFCTIFNWIILLIAFVSMLCVSKTQRKYIVGILLLTYVMICALIVLQRVVFRVMLPIYIVGIMAILYLGMTAENYRRKIMNVVSTCIALAFIIVGMGYNRYTKNIEMSNHQYETLRNYIVSHDEVLYVMHPFVKENFYGQPILSFNKENFFDNQQVVGGWDLYSIQYEKQMERYHILEQDRLLLSMVYANNIQYIKSGENERENQYLFQYIEEHTGKSVDVEVIKEFPEVDITICRLQLKD